MACILLNITELKKDKKVKSMKKYFSNVKKYFF